MDPDIDTERIRAMLEKHRKKMKRAIKLCVHCSLCAESCFLYTTRGKDPIYMPSHKFIHSTARLYRKKGKVDRAELEEIKEIAWKRCVLCMRCYCPLGIDIPELIALSRSICRSQNILPNFDRP